MIYFYYYLVGAFVTLIVLGYTAYLESYYDTYGSEYIQSNGNSFNENLDNIFKGTVPVIVLSFIIWPLILFYLMIAHIVLYNKAHLDFSLSKYLTKMAKNKHRKENPERYI